MNPPSSHFIAGVCANVTYWQDQVNQYTAVEMHYFQEEEANLLLAIKLGLAVPAAQTAAAQLLLAAFVLIERSGFWQRWLPLFTEAVSVVSPQHSVPHCKLLNRWGQLYRLLRRLDEAIAIHKRAEAMAQTCGDGQTLAESYFNLSANYRLNRDYEQARAYGQQALEIFAPLPAHEKWRAAVLNTLGLIELSCGNLNIAEERLRQSLALWQLVEQPTEQARVLNGLALTLHRKKQFEAALYFYQQACDLLQETGNELDKVEVYLNLGTLYFEWDKFDKAEINFRQANALALRHTSHFYFRAMIANNLGNVLLKRNHLDEAKEHLRRSRILWQQLNDNLMLANTTGTLERLCAKEAAYDTALTFFDEALTLLKGFDQDAWGRKLQRDFRHERDIVVAAMENGREEPIGSSP